MLRPSPPRLDEEVVLCRGGHAADAAFVKDVDEAEADLARLLTENRLAIL